MFPQDSILPSNTAPTSVPVPQHEWDVTGAPPEKPPHWDYGYVINGQTFSTTREQLPLMVVERGAAISFVWTPETPEPVSPERIPFLIEAFRRIQVREARQAIWFGGGLTAFGAIVTTLLDDWTLIVRNIFVVLGAVALTQGIWRYRQSRNYTQDDAIRDASGARFAVWVKDKSLTGYSLTLCACIVVVGIIQALSGLEESVAVAGLVKPAVWEGEIGRLFTATLMHGSFMHFWMNFFALIYLSKVVEHTFNRALVPLLFLVTGAFGSIFSVLLYPHATSVGASGGLMGLIGFITITAYLDRTKYPPRYFRLMLEGIVLIGALGLFGFAFIDNAAHFGGLVGGLMLGWFSAKRYQQQIESDKRLLTIAGIAAMGALLVVAAFAIYKMIG